MILKQLMIPLKKLVKSLEVTQEKICLNNNRTTTGPTVSKIIKDNVHLLQNNKILKGLFPENSIFVAKQKGG